MTLTDGGAGYTMPTVLFDLPDDPNGTRATGHVEPADLVGGVVQKVTVDDAGSGYTTAPGVKILDGTLSDPISGSTPAAASATLELVGLSVDVSGSGYTTATVSITDPTGAGAGATGTVTTDVGSLASITVTNGGSGYLTAGMKKFQDALPVTCNPGTTGSGCPAVPQAEGKDAATDPAHKFIPLAVPEAKTYSGKVADEYVIGLVQYRTRFSVRPPGNARARLRPAVHHRTSPVRASPCSTSCRTATSSRSPDTRASPRPSGSARSSRRRRTARSASSSATCSPRAPRATSSCPPTAR